MTVRIIHGDSLEMLKTLGADSVDSIVVDPPYGLSQHSMAEVMACLKAWLNGEVYKPKGSGFMGKSWDAWVPGPEVFREAKRVLKPGGYMLCFAGTRSMDLMSISIRLAGFELRDSIGYAHDDGGAPLMAWVHGSGFPKSRNVSKDINAFAATNDARKWDGFGTALKPAWEPIIMARKALDGTVAQNALKHGTGALNIDGCRIGDYKNSTPSGVNRRNEELARQGYRPKAYKSPEKAPDTPPGRWPANVIHDGSAEVLEYFPDAPGQLADASTDATSSRSTQNVYGSMARGNGRDGEASAGSGNEGAVDFRMKPGARRADAGSAARFFYCAKASRSDRNRGMGAGGDPVARNCNTHPTVKPTALMRYLVRLVTPPCGTVLDMYAGSGSTGVAADIEGFDAILIEREAEYVAIAKQRIAGDSPLFAQVDAA